MKTLRLALAVGMLGGSMLGGFILGGFAGCATVPVANTSNACGDPCANLACPSAFVCTVDTHCAARCQPEGMKPGGLP